MATASASRTIKVIDRGATFTCFIYSPSGDVFQEYDGDACYPNFEASNLQQEDKPKLMLIVTSSRASEGMISVSRNDTEFFFNGQKIQFGSNLISSGLVGNVILDNSVSGAFQIVEEENEQHKRVIGLRILKNLVPISGRASISITMKARVVVGTHADVVQATYTIPITPYTGASYKVVIAPGNLGNYLIASKGETCRLRAVVYKQGVEVKDNDFTYTWQRVTANGWEAFNGLQNSKSKEIDVRDTDVETQGMFRVLVHKGSSFIGSDVEMVLDVSDPYEIVCNPNRDEVIDLADPTKQKIVYSPKVVTRGSTSGVPGYTFRFLLMDGSGNPLNKADDTISDTDFTRRSKSFEVLLSHAQQSGGDMVLNIIAEKE